MIRLTNIPPETSPEAPKLRSFDQRVRSGLPPEYAEAAITNFNNHRVVDKDKIFPSTLAAIAGGFLWGETPEGHPFWHAVFLHLRNNLTPLPPFERRLI